MEQVVVEGGILTGEKIKIKSKDHQESDQATVHHQLAKRRHSAGKTTHFYDIFAPISCDCNAQNLVKMMFCSSMVTPFTSKLLERVGINHIFDTDFEFPAINSKIENTHHDSSAFYNL